MRNESQKISYVPLSEAQEVPDDSAPSPPPPVPSQFLKLVQKSLGHLLKDTANADAYGEPIWKFVQKIVADSTVAADKSSLEETGRPVMPAPFMKTRRQKMAELSRYVRSAMFRKCPPSVRALAGVFGLPSSTIHTAVKRQLKASPFRNRRRDELTAVTAKRWRRQLKFAASFYFRGHKVKKRSVLSWKRQILRVLLEYDVEVVELPRRKFVRRVCRHVENVYISSRDFPGVAATFDSLISQSSFRSAWVELEKAKRVKLPGVRKMQGYFLIAPLLEGPMMLSTQEECLTTSGVNVGILRALDHKGPLPIEDERKKVAALKRKREALPDFYARANVNAIETEEVLAQYISASFLAGFPNDD